MNQKVTVAGMLLALMAGPALAQDDIDGGRAGENTEGLYVGGGIGDFSAAVDEIDELDLRADGYAVGIARPGQRGRVDTIVDHGDLRRCEGDDVVPVVVAKDGVEVMEVTTSRAHDHDTAPRTARDLDVV